jgi:hypothetical protein
MLLATMWNSIKDIFEPIQCKTCKSKHYTAIGMVWHLWRKHNIKITKRDLKFLAIYNLITRLVIGVLCALLFLPLLVLKFILLPLHYLYEIL